MRKKMLIIGIIMLLIGVVIYGVAAYSTANQLTTSNSWLEYKNGEYISEPLNSSGGYLLTYSYSGSHAGVIVSNNLTKVNISNIGSFSLATLTNVNSEKAYNLNTGSYYIVIFSNSAPSITYTFVKLSTVLVTGIFTLVGITLAIAGIIVTILGAVLKPKISEK